MGKCTLLSKYLHLLGVEAGARGKKLLPAFVTLCMVLSASLANSFAATAFGQFYVSAVALRLPAAVARNSLSTGTIAYSGEKGADSPALARRVRVHYESSLRDNDNAQLHGVGAYDAPAPAFAEAAGTSHETGEADSDEEGADEKDSQDETGADDDDTSKTAPEKAEAEKHEVVPPASAEETKDNKDDDAVVGGPVEEEDEKDKAQGAPSSQEAGGKQEATAGTADEKGVHDAHASAETASKAEHEGGHRATGNETKTNRGAEEDTKGAAGESSTQREGEEANQSGHEYRIQFSFKPTVVIPSALKPTVRFREATDSEGRKWHEIVSKTKPEFLKVEGDSSSTVYNRPQVTYA